MPAPPLGVNLSEPIRIDKNRENKDLFVFLCVCCGSEVRYLKWKLKRGVSFVCLRCASRAKPPPPQFKSQFVALYNKLVAASKRRDIECQLSFEQFGVFTRQTSCSYCEATIHWASFSSSVRKVSYAFNLDRKDNSKGYRAENCVVCCCDCNKTKGDRFTYEEFIQLSPVLKQIEESRRNKNGA